MDKGLHDDFCIEIGEFITQFSSVELMINGIFELQLEDDREIDKLQVSTKFKDKLDAKENGYVLDSNVRERLLHLWDIRKFVAHAVLLNDSQNAGSVLINSRRHKEGRESLTLADLKKERLKIQPLQEYLLKHTRIIQATKKKTIMRAINYEA